MLLGLTMMNFDHDKGGVGVLRRNHRNQIIEIFALSCGVLPFLSTKLAVSGEQCFFGDSLPETKLPSTNCCAQSCSVGLHCVEVVELYERIVSANLVLLVRMDNKDELTSRTLYYEQ